MLRIVLIIRKSVGISIMKFFVMFIGVKILEDVFSSFIENYSIYWNILLCM